MTESAHLRMLMSELSTPDAVRKVRLVRVTHWQWLRDFPEAAKGKAQARGMNESRGANVTPKLGVTFVSFMMRRLGWSETKVERHITFGNRIPVPLLKAVAARDAAMKLTSDTRKGRSKGIRDVGVLLKGLSAQKPKEHPEYDWLRLIENHINPKQPPGNGLLGGALLNAHCCFIGEDSRPYLERLADLGHQFDAAILDPPYGTNLPRRVKGMMVDDKKGALWVIPLLKQLVKPGGVIGVWCSGKTLGRWANALLGEGLTIAQWVTWDKQSAWHEERGDEVMLVAGQGIPTSYGDPLSEISVPTLPANAPERQWHDTPKPVDLYRPIVERWTKPGDIVLDPMAGLAPLGVVCLQHGRRYWGAEIDPAVSWHALQALKGATPAPNRRRVVTAEDHAEWQRRFDAQQAAKRRAA